MTAVASSSRDGVFYEVQRIGNGWRCTCPGYTFRKTCRHINEYKDTTMTFPTTRNTPAEIATSEGAALQWANGKTMARSGNTARWQPLVGFHVEVGRDAEIDAAFARTNTPQWEIKHQRPGGAEIKAHWVLGENVIFYPLTSGPTATTISGMLKDAQGSIDAGLGVQWPQGERSRFAVRGYLDVLLAVGCAALVTLGVRSNMTARLLDALLDHCRTCEAADGLIDRTKHPAVVAMHELALPLGPDAEQEWGKGETATVVPLRSMHPEALDYDYITKIWRRKAVSAKQIDEGWEATVAWAAQYATGGEQRPADDLT